MNKILKYMAVAIFILTLAINVAITLDDPFVLMSDEAIATTSSDSIVDTRTGNGDGSFDQPEDIVCPESQWTTVYAAGSVFTITVDTGVSFGVAVPGEFIEMEATTNGTQITYTYRSSSNDGVTTETYRRICNDTFHLWGCSIKSCRVM